MFSTKLSLLASPFLKWAGGKSQLLPQYEPLFPKSYERYFEPFLGGGAVFFYLSPDRATLADINSELINVYIVVRDSVDDLIKSLRCHINTADYYYQLRSINPHQLDPVERASRFIFLNKTCYNGLYRVNRRGEFNVPFGRYNSPTICDERSLHSASYSLRHALIIAGDFEAIVADARRGDFVYMDPPYHPLNVTSSFTSYAEDGFGKKEQERLARVVRELDARGCLVMVSNSDTSLVRKLYAGLVITEVIARRAINSRGDRRGAISEVVIRNYS